ncbi:hypothetical protein OU798_04990 [Prolixibacteraceae bacterium Z1-6]|uniref:PepSY domain-containing protein n=1 Tax=Draconibacterium aestuarii TaxID=2998507 RepID=A0A9X3J6I4_9BACT|nr:hypothetical protein [Prolixibacteraceae bacterium Z1-6]
MERKRERKRRYTMRSLHRDIGFFVIGITIIYGLSGILLLYRDTDFLKSEKNIERVVAPNLKSTELGAALRMKGFKVVDEADDKIHFNNGSYNPATGEVKYTAKELPAFLNKLNGFHKIASSNVMHYVALVYALLLLFLAVSSFWMFKSKTIIFKRGLYLTGAGVVLTVIIFSL